MQGINGILRSRAFHILLISLAAFAAYSNTFGVPFHFDDMENIYTNPLVKDLSYFVHPSRADGIGMPSDLRMMWNTRRFGYLTFALNYELGGLDTTGYHIANLLIHVFAAVAVYLLVALAFRTPRMQGSSAEKHAGLIALFSGLLFAVHPVQTQAVTYIVQRFASMAALFYVASLVLYAKFRLAPGRRAAAYYALGLVSALLAAATKETAFTLPVAIVLFEVIFFSGPVRKRMLYALPFFIPMVVIPFSLLAVKGPLGDILSGAGMTAAQGDVPSRLQYLFTEFRVIVTYIRLLFLPANLNLDYDYPSYSSFLDIHVALSFVFLALTAGTGVFLLVRSRRSEPALRLVAFGIFWFFVTLSVESSIIPIADVIYEHRLYLPSIGAITAFTAAVFLFTDRIGGEKAVRTAAAALVLASIVLAVATYQRNAVWQSKVSLWEDVVRKSPLKARPRNNLGESYNDEGRFEEAMEQFKAAVRLDPLFEEAHLNLGLAYMGRNELEKAAQEFKYVLMINPQSRQAMMYLDYIRREEAR